MRITYRTLACLISKMNQDQLDSDVTIELSSSDECYPAELRIAGPSHGSLDENHPVLFIHFEDAGVRMSDCNQIAQLIGLKQD